MQTRPLMKGWVPGTQSSQGEVRRLPSTGTCSPEGNAQALLLTEQGVSFGHIYLFKAKCKCLWLT